MPKYNFHLQDDFAEDLAVDLADDAAAIDEGLKTASGLLRELQLHDVGECSHLLEVRTNGATVLRIEVHATRSR